MNKRFKGLDALRAIAALVVVIGHIELIKQHNGLPNVLSSNFKWFPDGHMGVVLFFVLSGFLITYLLLKEKGGKGKISFKSFYLRRILRIWPLYYAVIFLSFIIFRVNYDQKSIILCLTIFPNIAHAIGLGWPTSPQIWSIGVEEQFYLFWPLLISFISKKRIVPFLILFFIGYSILPHFLGFVNVRTISSESFDTFINAFFFGTKFNCMSVGAFFGVLYAHKNKALSYFYHPFISYPAIFLSFCLWFLNIRFSYFTDEVYAILFGIMILNIATNEKNSIKIDNKVFNFLGQISYGIYMYHWIIIMLIFSYLNLETIKNQIIFNLYLYSITIVATIFVSWVSYISFERFFLKLKKKYES